MIHLVYCDNTGKKGERELDKILSGEKTMVVRSAAGRKIPHSRVFKDETLYFIEKGTTNVSAKAIVKSVQNYVKLSEADINSVFDENELKLALSEKQRTRWQKKCICLVEFEKTQRIEQALTFEKQSNMDDWLIIDKIEDVLKGTSIPYNYKNIKL